MTLRAEESARTEEFSLRAGCTRVLLGGQAEDGQSRKMPSGQTNPRRA